jgi:hypothetical protein
MATVPPLSVEVRTSPLAQRVAKALATAARRRLLPPPVAFRIGAIAVLMTTRLRIAGRWRWMALDPNAWRSMP